MEDTAVKQAIDPVEWINEYGNYLLCYALYFVRKKEVAEDIVQETFLAALQAKGGFAGKSSEKTWLVGILKHKLVDYYRKSSRYSQFETDADHESFNEGFVRSGKWAGFWQTGSEPKDWKIDPASSAEQAAFRAVLNSCLAQLTPRLAAAFQLREIEQLSTKEICETLGVTESNLWVMLHRARQFLRACIEAKWLKRTNGAA